MLDTGCWIQDTPFEIAIAIVAEELNRRKRRNRSCGRQPASSRRAGLRPGRTPAKRDQAGL